jgi:hypothetical protein
MQIPGFVNEISMIFTISGARACFVLQTFDGSWITLRDCDRNCAKAFFDVKIKSDPSKSLPPDVTQLAVNARGIFFHPQVPKIPRCVYGICLNDIQSFSYATKVWLPPPPPL